MLKSCKWRQGPDSGESVSVNLDSPLRSVSDQFLSVTLGPTDISKNWATEALKSKSLINMGRVLSPVMLRVGGTDEDYVTFKNQSEVSYRWRRRKEEGRKEEGGIGEREGRENRGWGGGWVGVEREGDSRPNKIINSNQNYSVPQFDSKTINWSNFTLLYSQWDALNEFSQAVGWDMVYGLNSKLRNPWPHGAWDTTNAEELLKYTISKGYDVSWELGNGMFMQEILFISAITVSGIL